MPSDPPSRRIRVGFGETPPIKLPSGDPPSLEVEGRVEPLSAFVQRVWVAHDDYERTDRAFAVTEIMALEADLRRLRSALDTIRGPEDRGPWIDIYRKAGGGYQGLQAIARAALDSTREQEK